MASQATEKVDARPFFLTKQHHRAAHPAISPSRPELSQADRTVLVTGGSDGIGFAIAQAFGTAGAKKVIIVGRDEVKLQMSARRLAEECNGQTAFEGRRCQLADSDSITRLWNELGALGEHVDVLVLNAAKTDAVGSMMDLGWRCVWEAFEVNVRSSLQLCERMWKQPPMDEHKRYVVNVSTSAIHYLPSYAPTYGLTKNSATLLLQQLARKCESRDMQIVSYHPGALLTPGAKGLGLVETSLDWDDISLPAATAVWAASDEAEFLHGRFFWAAWDVEELQSGELRERLDKDGKFLRIGVHGLRRLK